MGCRPSNLMGCLHPASSATLPVVCPGHRFAGFRCLSFVCCCSIKQRSLTHSRALLLTYAPGTNAASWDRSPPLSRARALSIYVFVCLYLSASLSLSLPGRDATPRCARPLQGYLALKKHPPPWTLQWTTSTVLWWSRGGGAVTYARGAPLQGYFAHHKRPPQEHQRTLGIGLLWGLEGGGILRVRYSRNPLCMDFSEITKRFPRLWGIGLQAMTEWARGSY